MTGSPRARRTAPGRPLVSARAGVAAVLNLGLACTPAFHRVECFSAEDCPAGEVCSSGHCLPPTPNLDARGATAVVFIAEWPRGGVAHAVAQNLTGGDAPAPPTEGGRIGALLYPCALETYGLAEGALDLATSLPTPAGLAILEAGASSWRRVADDDLLAAVPPDWGARFDLDPCPTYGEGVTVESSDWVWGKHATIVPLGEGVFLITSESGPLRYDGETLMRAEQKLHGLTAWAAPTGPAWLLDDHRCLWELVPGKPPKRGDLACEADTYRRPAALSRSPITGAFALVTSTPRVDRNSGDGWGPLLSTSELPASWVKDVAVAETSSTTVFTFVSWDHDTSTTYVRAGAGVRLLDVPHAAEDIRFLAVAPNDDVFVAGQTPLLYRFYRLRGTELRELGTLEQERAVDLGAAPAGFVALMETRVVHFVSGVMCTVGPVEDLVLALRATQGGVLVLSASSVNEPRARMTYFPRTREPRGCYPVDLPR